MRHFPMLALCGAMLFIFLASPAHAAFQDSGGDDSEQGEDPCPTPTGSDSSGTPYGPNYPWGQD